MPVIRRLVGAGIAAFGVHGMAASAEAAEFPPPTIVSNAESAITSSQDLTFEESIPLVTDHLTNQQVIAYGVVTVAGLVMVVFPNSGRRSGGRSRSSGYDDGGGFFSFDFGGGDGDGDCGGGDGGGGGGCD